ncbi:MAG: hypothetical protein V3S89_05330 [Desulfobacterales bacterium]
MKIFSLLSVILCSLLVLTSPVLALDTQPNGHLPMGPDGLGMIDADSGSDRNPIKYALPLGDFTLLAVIEESGARALSVPGKSALANGSATYSLAGIHKIPLGFAGLRLNLESDTSVAAMDQKGFTVNPFLRFGFNNISLEGGLRYQWRDISFADDPNTTAGDALRPSIDISRLAANVELQATLGPVNLEVGYTHMFGKSDGNADSAGTWFWNSFGDNWDKVWILAANNEKGYASLGGGGLGNLVLSTVGAGTFQAGAKLVYIKGALSPTENMDVSLLFASSRAENTPAGWSDKQGTEWDVEVSYSFLDNLSYTFIAAYLVADDFWKKGETDLDLENTYSVFNQLKLKF